jgi:hypothetical protein
VRTLAPLGLVVALVLTSRLAAASPGIGVVVAGEPTLQGKVRAQAGVWIQRHGYALVSRPLSADSTKTLSNCFVIEDTSCARGVFEKQAQAEYLLFLRVELAPGKQRDVDLTGYWFIKDRDVVADKRACKPCGNAALNQNVTELLTSLFASTGLSKARVRIGTPPGLVVMLDGANIGLTPLEEDVPPGTHTVALERDGKEVGSSSVDVKAGDVTDVVVPIRSGEPPPPPPPREIEHHASLASKLLIATGAGAIAVGSVFVYYGHRNGPNDPLIYPDANAQGIVIASLGGAALITGLVLVWRDSSTNGPTASISSSGTMIGWAGRF